MKKKSRLTKEAVSASFNHSKMKVSVDQANARCRAKLIRSI